MKTLKTSVLAGILIMLAGTAWAGQTILWLESTTHDCAFAPDDTIRMNIRLDSVNNPIDVIGMGIRHYWQDFDLIRVERGSLIASWPALQINISDGPVPSEKQINIDGAGPAIPAGVSGYLATLVYVFKSCGASTFHDQICWAQLWGDFDESVEDIDERCGYIDVYPKSSAPGRLAVESLYHTCSAVEADTIDVNVRLDQTTQDIDAAGVDLAYDAGILEYVGFKRGDLTAAWPFFDVAELPQKLRVGGFTSTAIPSGSSGVFVTLRFIMHCCGMTTVASVCTQSPVDDFAGIPPECGYARCAPLATHAVNWGYVKSLYR